MFESSLGQYHLYNKKIDKIKNFITQQKIKRREKGKSEEIKRDG